MKLVSRGILEARLWLRRRASPSGEKLMREFERETRDAGYTREDLDRMLRIDPDDPEIAEVIREIREEREQGKTKQPRGISRRTQRAGRG